MRPPVCAICNKEFQLNSGEGDGMQFKLSEKEILLQEKEMDIVAHPYGYEWFCKRHLKRAEKYQHLTLENALQQMIKPINILQRLRVILFPRRAH